MLNLPNLPDASHLAAIAAIVAGLVLAWVNLLKPLIELRLKPTDPAHDPVLRLLAVVLGAGGLLLGAYASAVFNLVALATGIAIGSYGGFHLIATPSPAQEASTGTLLQSSAEDIKPLQPWTPAESGVEVGNAPAEVDPVPIKESAAIPVKVVNTITPSAQTVSDPLMSKEATSAV
jgi:hypothetical protein